MILTYKIKHGRDFTEELSKAMRVAEFAIANRDKLSSKYVSHIGLPSVISCQVLRKYGRNKKCKSVSKAVLTVPGQSVRTNCEDRLIRIPCLKLEMSYRFRNDFTKINQVELNNEYAFVSVTIDEPEVQEVNDYIGIDLNTTGHSAVAADPTSGKVLKLGKSENHTRSKYRNLRSAAQKDGRWRDLRKLKGREKHKINDLNHKISRTIVDWAHDHGLGIAMEDLKGIRDRTNCRSNRNFRGQLNNWSFSDLRKKVEYKARLLGIPVVAVDPAYTSQTCSRCGEIGDREGKTFECPKCGHADHADVNAAFNISMVASGQKEMSEMGAMTPPGGSAHDANAD